MSLKTQWFVNIAMVIVSWLSLPLLGRRDIKKYFPASVLIVLLEVFHVQIGKKKKWWIFYNKPESYFTGEFPFNIGPFLVSSMWILKWTYGHFKKFIFANAILNAFFAFFLIRILEYLKVAKLVRFNQIQFFLYFFFKAFILYVFHYIVEKIRK